MNRNPSRTAQAYGYDTLSFDARASRRSAEVVVPLLFEQFRPNSVVDLGCGLGDWLAEFRRCGCSTVVGYDGAWVPMQNLQIAETEFRIVDFSVDVLVSGRFDMALCLEVAEHVSPAAGDNLVRNLAGCSDVIVFSAAIPGQRGIGHVNEQYQSHWIEKFERYDFKAFDLIRPRIWSDERVSWWYRQNALVFASPAACKKFDLVEAPIIADIVHPILYDRARSPENWGGRAMVAALARRIARRFRGEG